MEMKKFSMTSTKKWLDKDGASGVQVEQLLCRVTFENVHRFDYEVEEVVSVENAPSFYKKPTGGGVAKKFLDKFIGDNDVKVIA